MTFKMGETCDGCDAIVNNIKKVAGKNVKNNEYAFDKNNNTKGVEEFMEGAVEKATKASSRVVSKINQAKQYKVKK